MFFFIGSEESRVRDNGNCMRKIKLKIDCHPFYRRKIIQLRWATM
jgi:hypothetical protein